MIFDKFFSELKLKLIKKHMYNYILPIGEGCYSAQVLKNAKIRMFSGPFDWVRIPNYIVSIDLIKNDFKNYFNKEDLEFFKTSDLTQSDWYINKRTKIIYRHDFKSNSLPYFDECYKSIYEKYKRRYNRLLNIINSKKCKKICLLYIERADVVENTDPIPDKINNSQLKKEIDALNKHFKKKCFDIFYFKHEPKYNCYKYKIKGRICYINNSYFSECAFGLAAGNYKLVNKIVQKRFALEPDFIYKLILLIDYYKAVYGI